MSFTDGDVSRAAELLERVSTCSDRRDRLITLAQALCAEREHGKKLAQAPHDTKPRWRVRLHLHKYNSIGEGAATLTGFARGATWQDAVSDRITRYKLNALDVKRVGVEQLDDDSGEPL